MATFHQDYNGNQGQVNNAEKFDTKHNNENHNSNNKVGGDYTLGNKIESGKNTNFRSEKNYNSKNISIYIYLVVFLILITGALVFFKINLNPPILEFRFK